MLVIVRHGNTFESGEKPRRIGARTDLPLTRKGWEQARALGAHFAAQGMRFESALISPLTRTRQTAQAILDAQDQPPPARTAAFLREIDYGPDENQLEDDVLARIGRPALEAWEQRADPPEGWIVDAAERVDAWKTLMQQMAKRAGPTLLVTSNGAARYALLANAALLQASQNLESLKLPTGGFGIIARADDGGLSLSAWASRP